VDVVRGRTLRPFLKLEPSQVAKGSLALRHIALGESKLQQVNRAIAWIKTNFREPFSIDAVAVEARMSPSTLHEHFKVVTSMSSLQYQKQPVAGGAPTDPVAVA